MKKILVLLVIIAASFNANAGMVRIQNTYGVTFTGRFTVNQLNFYPSMTTGPGWGGSVVLTVPPMGLTFSDVGAFYAATTGGTFPGSWGPPAQYLLWGITFQGTGASAGCVFNGQIGSNVAYGACGVWTSPFNVKMSEVSGDVTIEIY